MMSTMNYLTMEVLFNFKALQILSLESPGDYYCYFMELKTKKGPSSLKI